VTLPPPDLRLERLLRDLAPQVLGAVSAEKTTSVPERNYLMMRAARLGEGP
jgi:hypothetical protein